MKIFYDASCPFCQRWVERIKRWDKREIFSYVPQSKKMDSLLLEEANGRTWVRGRAVLRIFWLLGGWWRLIGWIYVVPVLPDLVYRLVARFRHHF